MADSELKDVTLDILREHFPRVLFVGSVRIKVGQRLGKEVEAISHILRELEKEGKAEFCVGGEWRYIPNSA